MSRRAAGPIATSGSLFSISSWARRDIETNAGSNENLETTFETARRRTTARDADPGGHSVRNSPPGPNTHNDSESQLAFKPRISLARRSRRYSANPETGAIRRQPVWPLLGITYPNIDQTSNGFSVFCWFVAMAAVQIEVAGQKGSHWLQDPIKNSLNILLTGCFVK